LNIVLFFIRFGLEFLDT